MMLRVLSQNSEGAIEFEVKDCVCNRIDFSI